MKRKLKASVKRKNYTKTDLFSRYWKFAVIVSVVTALVIVIAFSAASITGRFSLGKLPGGTQPGSWSGGGSGSGSGGSSGGGTAFNPGDPGYFGMDCNGNGNITENGQTDGTQCGSASYPYVACLDSDADLAVDKCTYCNSTYLGRYCIDYLGNKGRCVQSTVGYPPLPDVARYKCAPLDVLDMNGAATQIWPDCSIARNSGANYCDAKIGFMASGAPQNENFFTYLEDGVCADIGSSNIICIIGTVCKANSLLFGGCSGGCKDNDNCDIDVFNPVVSGFSPDGHCQGSTCCSNAFDASKGQCSQDGDCNYTCIDRPGPAYAGVCNSSCLCQRITPPKSLGCVVGQCNATCAVDADCVKVEGSCDNSSGATLYIQTNTSGACTGNCSCDYVGGNVVIAHVGNDTDGDGIDEKCEKFTLNQTVNDADGDGYLGTVDCDDWNAKVYPGAKEICNNNIDDDCNGLTDSADPTCKLSAEEKSCESSDGTCCARCEGEELRALSSTCAKKEKCCEACSAEAPKFEMQWWMWVLIIGGAAGGAAACLLIWLWKSGKLGGMMDSMQFGGVGKLDDLGSMPPEADAK